MTNVSLVYFLLLRMGIFDYSPQLNLEGKVGGRSVKWLKSQEICQQYLKMKMKMKDGH